MAAPQCGWSTTPVTCISGGCSRCTFPRDTAHCLGMFPAEMCSVLRKLGVFEAIVAACGRVAGSRLVSLSNAEFSGDGGAVVPLVSRRIASGYRTLPQDTDWGNVQFLEEIGGSRGNRGCLWEGCGSQPDTLIEDESARRPRRREPAPRGARLRAEESPDSAEQDGC